MALSNPWWETDPQQRFWVEITGREDLGANLLSPKTGRGGRPTPGYESMTHVSPGDVVFHYWQQAGQEPALVAYSIAVGRAKHSSITWRPHGKNSTQLEPQRSVAWEVPLGGMTDLERPVTLSMLRRRSDQIRELLDRLEGSYGAPIYFPFSWYRGELRPNQYYLTKFPAELVDLFAELSIDRLPDTPTPDVPHKEREPRSRTTGYVSDPVLRKAIEMQAMKQAEQFLQRRGYSTSDVSATSPYDLHASSPDGELIVEVKGSSGTATSVELTIGEVNKALDESVHAFIIVVDQIPFTRQGANVVTQPGRLRYLSEWDNTLTESRLQPTRFRFLLPPLSADEAH